jgi:predicted phage tail protein
MMAVLVLLAAWGVNYFGDTEFNISALQKQQKNQALIKAGDECVSISERASAHLVPKLEFQRLELEARKANVVVRCMADRDFYQSPAWLKYAEPIAAKISQERHISMDEALETMKRADMLVFEPLSKKPVYWQYVKKSRQ